MPRFTLRIIAPSVHRDVVVEVGSFDQAIDLADAFAVSGSKVGFIRNAEDDARLSTYTCEFCNAQTLKELWGPGRITCPACGKQARSAAERGETT